MEESQVADYFVVAGLPNQPEPMDDYTDKSHLKQNQRYRTRFMVEK